MSCPVCNGYLPCLISPCTSHHHCLQHPLPILGTVCPHAAIHRFFLVDSACVFPGSQQQLFLPMLLIGSASSSVNVSGNLYAISACGALPAPKLRIVSSTNNSTSCFAQGQQSLSLPVALWLLELLPCAISNATWQRAFLTALLMPPCAPGCSPPTAGALPSFLPSLLECAGLPLLALRA